MRLVPASRPRYETVVPAADSSFAARRSTAGSFPHIWHYHPELELTLIRRGSGLRFVADSIELYWPGDVVLIGENVPHTWQSEAVAGRPVESVVAQFRSDVLVDASRPSAEFAGLRSLFARARRGLHVSGDAAERVATLMQRLTPETEPLPRWLSLVEALDVIARAPRAQCRPLASAAGAAAVGGAAGRKLQRVFDYLRRHVVSDAADGSLCQADVAAAVGMTPEAFSRFFRRNVGCTYARYVNEWRINLACQMLVQGEQDVISIAFACGFANLSNFNRRFRQIKNTTPSAFRQLFRAAAREDAAD